MPIPPRAPRKVQPQQDPRYADLIQWLTKQDEKIVRVETQIQALANRTNGARRRAKSQFRNLELVAKLLRKQKQLASIRRKIVERSKGVITKAKLVDLMGPEIVQSRAVTMNVLGPDMIWYRYFRLTVAGLAIVCVAVLFALVLPQRHISGAEVFVLLSLVFVASCLTLPLGIMELQGYTTGGVTSAALRVCLNCCLISIVYFFVRLLHVSALYYFQLLCFFSPGRYRKCWFPPCQRTF
jgi:hypothetical protein